jgi:L-ascorbate metabolism protein UlaG (beta-lactamase superfamily)
MTTDWMADAGSARRQTADVIRIHYLGHAAFVLQFGDTVVLADYGKPNAWKEWGWDSPIHDIGDLVPDLATYSHTHHDDHYAPERLPAGTATVLTEPHHVFRLGELTISPIPLHELDVNTPDSAAFLFDYRGARVLHLGDCQADIMASQRPETASRLRELIPQNCDLVLMPIEGKQQFFPQILPFLEILQPRRVVPMHYWSAETLSTFLTQAAGARDASEADYRIRNLPSPQLRFAIEDRQDSTHVIGLQPEPIRMWHDA